MHLSNWFPIKEPIHAEICIQNKIVSKYPYRVKQDTVTAAWRRMSAFSLGT